MDKNQAKKLKPGTIIMASNRPRSNSGTQVPVEVISAGQTMWVTVVKHYQRTTVPIDTGVLVRRITDGYLYEFRATGDHRDRGVQDANPSADREAEEVLIDPKYLLAYRQWENRAAYDEHTGKVASVEAAQRAHELAETYWATQAMATAKLVHQGQYEPTRVGMHAVEVELSPTELIAFLQGLPAELADQRFRIKVPNQFLAGPRPQYQHPKGVAR